MEQKWETMPIKVNLVLFRWLNHLNPTLGQCQSQEQMDLDILFSLIRIHGKKWKLISNNMVTKTDNSIKNFFYSSLKKGLRNLNFYNTQIRQNRRYKCFKQELIEKILSVHDEKKSKDLLITDMNAFPLAQKIRESLMRCYQDNLKLNTVLSVEMEACYSQLSDQVSQFCRVCKFKKSTRNKDKFENKKFQAFERKQQKKVINDEESMIGKKSICTQPKDIKGEQQISSQLFENESVLQLDELVDENFEENIAMQHCDGDVRDGRLRFEYEMLFLEDNDVVVEDQSLLDNLCTNFTSINGPVSLIY